MDIAGLGPLSSSSTIMDGDNSMLSWVEDCVVSALSQLGPTGGAAGGAGGVAGTVGTQGSVGDRMAAGPERARAAAGLARVAAGVGPDWPRMCQAGVAAVHDWLKWVRKARDAGDGAVAEAFAALLNAADSLLRALQHGQSALQSSEAAASTTTTTTTTTKVSLNVDDLTADVLLWPWGAGASESPSDTLRVAKMASLRAALAAAAVGNKPSTAAAVAMKKTLVAAVGDEDEHVRAAAAFATPAAHLLAVNTDTSAPLLVVATPVSYTHLTLPTILLV